MTYSKNLDAPVSETHAATEALKPWATPVLTQISAGSAEGPGPVGAADGGTGS